jgi:hypothetical protein
MPSSIYRFFQRKKMSLKRKRTPSSLLRGPVHLKIQLDLHAPSLFRTCSERTKSPNTKPTPLFLFGSNPPCSTHCIVLYSCGKSQSSHFWLRHNSSFVCAPPFSSSEQRPSPHSLARRERKLAAPRDFAPAWATSSEGPQRGRPLRSLRPLPRLATFAVWLVLRGGPESEQGSSHRPCATGAQRPGQVYGSTRFGLATLPRCTGVYAGVLNRYSCHTTTTLIKLSPAPPHTPTCSSLTAVARFRAQGDC